MLLCLPVNVVIPCYFLITLIWLRDVTSRLGANHTQSLIFRASQLLWHTCSSLFPASFLSQILCLHAHYWLSLTLMILLPVFIFPSTFNFLTTISSSGEGNGTTLQYSCLENPMDRGAWWAAVHGIAKSWTRLSDFTFTFHFHALKKEMATYSSVLAWRIPGTEEPGRRPPLGSHRVGHDWSDLAAAAAASLLFTLFSPVYPYLPLPLLLIFFLPWHVFC